ncbi:MAG TPA: hypothetical protein P5080_00435 [Candidatus Paceibacterota bacterium]|nr:hypothetical protein [Candidatus Pacearchaeota archaeon]HRZ50442.1 hypothetical protein [Candidatus Paceibacterota bacterium]HSA36163.1 hypothetical protein [Candidatus Paceibacterota bacterium]
MVVYGEKKYFDRQFLAGAVALAIVFIFFVGYSLKRGHWFFLDNVNLVIHEAGHVMFMFFGEFASFAGGTVAQLALPLSFVLYFLLKRQFVSASAVMFWFGENLVNVSIYAADANDMVLPLLGGGMHDWNYMLGETRLLYYAPQIAGAFYSLGMLVYCLALAVGLYGLFRNSLDRKLPPSP